MASEGVPRADRGRGSAQEVWDDRRPDSGMHRAFNPQDDTGVGLSVLDGVGGGRRWVRHQSVESGRLLRRSGTPPGVFLGAGLAALDGGRGVEIGSAVSEQHLFNLLGMCADPISGDPWGVRPTARSSPRRAGGGTSSGHGPSRQRPPNESSRGPGRGRGTSSRDEYRTPVAGFDLTFSPTKSVSVAWALADEDTKAVIYDCHRRAIESSSPTPSARSSTRVRARTAWSKRTSRAWWPPRSPTSTRRAGDPQLHDHVVVANRARSVSDGGGEHSTRGLFKAWSRSPSCTRACSPTC